ncbi:adenylate/guanylate cyclase domain-containing protein [Desulfobacterota bacterium AH_259_B03_O07]|nr:adenylate/guanylate cyclase domain-containing protein [Desulfobacterota bacterium AH_259_B03_O07]
MIKINPKTRAYLINIINTTIFWVLAVFLFVVLRTVGIVEGGDLLKFEHDQLRIDVLVMLTGGLVLGIAFGILDIFLDTEKIRKRSYGFIILIKSVFHISILILATYIIVVIISLSEAGFAFRHEYSFSLSKWIISGDFLAALIYTLVASLIISLIKQVGRTFGPGNLLRFMMGTYHHPKEEERIFMFLDMKSSSTHAEKLGHIKYSKLIQDCFYYLTDVVLERKVEIYHYVGDEAILTWRVNEGLEDANCIKTYFDFEEEIKEKAEYYDEEYGVVPEFKAGLNIGLVTIAEVGEIKRELHFHGDVLNTASRIEGECNRFNKKILISKHLKDRLPRNLDLIIDLIGNISLKGREKTLDVYSVEMKGLTSI